jgi:hypothetical protein
MHMHIYKYEFDACAHILCAYVNEKMELVFYYMLIIGVELN